ncbi:MAG: iron-sulfur cluster assembly protein [Aigarchaeota archaeon]|nr:iron-sulfur cluster assembly protein [Aigarchaeota archaeon]MDW8092618.1 iron-sulfur cluster assembly protein [Nitrososphaerota archaeon]
MSEITVEKVLETLKSCYDPEIPVNIVDLGLIYDVKIEGDYVKIKMTLTAPGCPVGFFLNEQVKEAIMTAFPSIKKVDVELVFDPPWTPEKMSEEAKAILGML